MSSAMFVSIVIPIYNEEAGLASLFARLYPVLDAQPHAYELILVDDGSRDASPRLLREQHERRPDVTRVLLLARNAGQHCAILAGFEHSQGDVVVTLDADLQNPPEEIPRLIHAVAAGHDFVSTIRRERQDSWFRRNASRLMNRLRHALTPIRITDQGSMLCAYSRSLVDAINECPEATTFIPALASILAGNQTEIEVAHEERRFGQSKYPLSRLIRLNFDLLTGFSVAPLAFVSMAGIVIAIGSVLFYLAVMISRALEGDWWLGIRALWDRDILQFFLIGIILVAQGVLGEYVGRIYQEVRRRPRYRIREQLRPQTQLQTHAQTQPPSEPDAGEHQAHHNPAA